MTTWITCLTISELREYAKDETKLAEIEDLLLELRGTHHIPLLTALTTCEQTPNRQNATFYLARTGKQKTSKLIGFARLFHMGGNDQNQIETLSGLQLHVNSSTASSYFLSMMIVHKDYRGYGVASQILDMIFEKMQSEHSLLFIEVRTTNTQAIEVFFHRGFRELVKYERYGDRITLMCKNPL